jgi:hypothetical protein
VPQGATASAGTAPIVTVELLIQGAIAAGRAPTEDTSGPQFLEAIYTGRIADGFNGDPDHGESGLIAVGVGGEVEE